MECSHTFRCTQFGVSEEELKAQLDQRFALGLLHYNNIFLHTLRDLLFPKDIAVSARIQLLPDAYFGPEMDRALGGHTSLVVEWADSPWKIPAVRA